MHLLLCFVLIWVFSRLNLHDQYLDWEVDELRQVLLFTAEMFIAGGLLGGWLFGVYLLLSSRLTGAHINEVFSSQSLTTFKNFLRLKFAADGSLVIHAIGVRETPKTAAYTYAGDRANAGDAWFIPPENGINCELIERIPIRTT
jgi:hypothetical protein